MPDTVTRDLRYQYNEKEHLRLAEDLGHEITRCAAAEKLFAISKAAHKEAVEAMQCTIRDLSRKLSDGWEVRDVPCYLLPNDPEPGRRTIVRIDTGEIIAIEDMQTGQKVEERPVDKLFETDVQVSADSHQASDHASNGKVVPDNATAGEPTGPTQPVSAESILLNPAAEASTEERARTRKAKHRGQDAILPDPRKTQQLNPEAQP